MHARAAGSLALLLAASTVLAGCAGPGTPAGPKDFRDCLEGNPPAGQPLTVQVTAPDGTPAEGACVTASIPGARVLVQQRADAQGAATLRLPDGNWTVQATLALPGDPGCAFVNRTWVLVPGAVEVPLALPEAPRVCG